MARWIRNLHTPFVADAWGSHLVCMVWAEVFRVAGYTLDSDNGDAAWTAANNIIVDEAGGGGVGTGFQVDAGVPFEIYDTQGRFTQAMVDDEHMISLRDGLTGYDQNASSWRIIEYIDANRVKVDPDGFNPFGWQTDTELAGRVVKFDGTVLGAGAWAIFNAPSPHRQQIRIEHTSTSIANIQIAPMGQAYADVGAGTPDAITGTAPSMVLSLAAGRFNKHMVGLNVTIAGSANPLDDGVFPITAVGSKGQITYTNAAGVGDANFTGTISVPGISTLTTAINMGDYYNNRFRLNMYSDDDVMSLYYLNQDSEADVMSVGHLLNAADDDTDPAFIYAGRAGQATDPWLYTMRMLDGNTIPADIQMYPSFWKRTYTYQDASCFYNLERRRLVNGSPGKAPVIEPMVIAPNVAAGGYARGRLPKIRFGYTGFDQLRPIDSVGAWVHWFSGLFFPRNGPDDQFPMYPEAS